MKKFLITKDMNIQQALIKLDESMGLGLIVVDELNKLHGTITDGDIRRAISAGLHLDSTIDQIMFRSPKTAEYNTPDIELRKLTNDHRIKLIPIIKDGIVVDVFTVDLEETKDIPVVLMAGGLGTRLGHLTKDCPKPMLDVAGKPVLHRIIEKFTRVGFRKFFISVNFKAEMIEDYFKDGSDFGCEIKYLKEEKRMGTAGSLSLLPGNLKGPLVIANGDLLTLVDFRRLVSFHQQHQAPMTICTRKYEFQVPFGVVKVNDGFVQSIDEKPTQVFNVSAGVYVINANVLRLIPNDDYFDMPSLIEKVMSSGEKTCCFPMVEQWIDIGQVSDLDYARSVYGESK